MGQTPRQPTPPSGAGSSLALHRPREVPHPFPRSLLRPLGLVTSHTPGGPLSRTPMAIPENPPPGETPPLGSVRTWGSLGHGQVCGYREPLVI